MVKVKYWDTVEPQEFEVDLETEQEACEWIERQMSDWWDTLRDEYPDVDITWLNRYLDVSNVTEIYIPDSLVSICCEIVR